MVLPGAGTILFPTGYRLVPRHLLHAGSGPPGSLQKEQDDGTRLSRGINSDLSIVRNFFTKFPDPERIYENKSVTTSP